MTSDIYWINDKLVGEKKIGTMARPRGGDWLEDEIKWLKLKEVDCLVSMLESSEVWELQLQQEKELCDKFEIQFINFPVKDVGIPAKETAFIELTKEIASKVKQGKKVVVHCRMGIGRSSMLVAAVLIKLGQQAKNVFDVIKEYRKLNVPDTDEQKEWILQLEKKLV